MVMSTGIAWAHSRYRRDASNSCQPVKVFSQPPADFDPTVASDSALQQYGFPPRPSTGANSPALQTWTQAVGSQPTFVPPDPVCTSRLHADLYTNNWAGHVALNTNFPGSPHFTYAESSWTQPSVAGNGNYPDTEWASAPAASFWVGTGYNDILQAGVDSISVADSEYRFWTEDFPAGSNYEGPVISPGDVAYVSVEYLGNGTESYYLDNLTTNKASSFVNPAPYDGWGSADFVMERLTGDALGDDYLPGFADTLVTSNDFGSATQSFNLTTNNQRDIISSDCTSTGTILSRPTAVDNSTSNFTQKFYNSRPYSDTCNPTGG
jgi:hypothetical protein